MSAIHKLLCVYFGLMNLKYAWILQNSCILKTDWKHPYKTQQHSKLDEPKKNSPTERIWDYCWAFTLKSCMLRTAMLRLKQCFLAAARPGESRRICQLMIDFYGDVKGTGMTAAHISTQISCSSAENSSMEKSAPNFPSTFHLHLCLDSFPLSWRPFHAFTQMLCRMCHIPHPTPFPKYACLCASCLNVTFSYITFGHSIFEFCCGLAYLSDQT